MVNQKLVDFTTKYEITYTVIVNLQDYTSVSIGWKYKLPFDGLFNSLFGSEESVKDFNNSLEGQIMPQSMKQGDLKCVVVKPRSDMLVGLFYNDKKDTIESYKFGKQLNDELIELINSKG